MLPIREAVSRVTRCPLCWLFGQARAVPSFSLVQYSSRSMRRRRQDTVGLGTFRESCRARFLCLRANLEISCFHTSIRMEQSDTIGGSTWLYRCTLADRNTSSSSATQRWPTVLQTPLRETMCLGTFTATSRWPAPEASSDITLDPACIRPADLIKLAGGRDLFATSVGMLQRHAEPSLDRNPGKGSREMHPNQSLHCPAAVRTRDTPAPSNFAFPAGQPNHYLRTIERGQGKGGQAPDSVCSRILSCLCSQSHPSHNKSHSQLGGTVHSFGVSLSFPSAASIEIRTARHLQTSICCPDRTPAPETPGYPPPNAKPRCHPEPRQPPDRQSGSERHEIRSF
jgi:hypothetical protein